MRTVFKYMAVVFAASAALTSVAQDLRTGFFSDYFLYRHDINPAYANDSSYFSIPVVGNINVGMMGNFGYEEVVRNNPLYPNRSNKKMTSFMNPYIDNPLKGFASGDNKINGEVKTTIMSVGFKKWSGYNTVELNVRANADLRVPYRLFQFAAEASNERYDIGDINAAAQAFTELSFGHSRQIDRKLRVGAKLKLLVGLADIDLKMKNVVADLKEANQWSINADAESHVSMKGFKYLSKKKTYNASEATYDHINDVDVDGFGISGFGAAIDAGAIYKVNDDFTVNASIRDLGAIVWSSDYRATNDAKSFIFDGFHDVSANSSSPDKLDNKADKYTDQLLDFANLRDKGDKGTRVTGIGAVVSAGCEYVIPTFKMLKVGLLGTARINGPFTWAEARLGGNISPVSWFDGTASLSVNNYSASIGLLANFHTRHVNFFVGFDSLTKKVSKEFIPLNSNGGVSLGFNVMM